jgi:hypothetical protein
MFGGKKADTDGSAEWICGNKKTLTKRVSLFDSHILNVSHGFCIELFNYGQFDRMLLRRRGRI